MTKKNDYYGQSKVRDDDAIIVAAFDVESRGLGGELLSIQTGIFGDITFDKSPEMIDNFYARILQYAYPVVWFAHFAQYDWRYLMDWLITSGLEFEVSMRTDNDIYQITIKKDKKKYVMRDSYAIWNSPLEKLASSFCPELPKLKIDIENFNPDDPEHVEYAKQDVRILLVGLPRLFSMLQKHFDVNPNATFASTSLKGWQKSLPENQYYNSSKYDAQELFVRQAYYGGIVFLTDTNKHENCETFDINSAYPAVMCDYGVPYGRAIETTDYHDKRMGIYRCRVKAPDNLRIPIIPARDKKGSMRWYCGEFDTVCTNRELIFAANNGYEIIDIYEGIVYEETVYPFNDYIELCKTIRKQFKGGPEEHLAKFMQNSLYGKYGSKRERRRVFAAALADPEMMLGATPIDDDGKWYSKKELDDGMRTLPQWAVFITAHARLRLLQAAYTAGVENVLYGDTDSLTIKSGHSEGINVGDEYGQFKLEKEWKVFRAIAPKVYSGILQDGKDIGAAKGLPRKNLNATHWRELLEDGTTSAQALSLNSLRVSLKNGVQPAQMLLRKSSTLDNSINYSRLSDGRVSLKMRA